MPGTSASDGRERLAGAYSIELSRIRPDPTQPRQDLDTEKQRQLVASIRRLGVLQPIVVRWLETDQVYQILYGERRYQASKELGLPSVPCWIQSPKDEEILLRQIVENWQRADLHPYELADSLMRLRDANNYTQKQLAEETGKPESEISRLLSLERIDPEVQKIAREDVTRTFTKRHLVNVARLKAPEEQREVAQEIQERKLTAIETEEEVSRRIPDAKGRKKRGAPVTHMRYATSEATVTLNFRKRNVSAADILGALDEVRLKIASPAEQQTEGKG